MTHFDKHPDFRVKEVLPFNGEPPLSLLRQSWITPTRQFFSRNHAPIPQVDPAAYRLEISGLVERPLLLSLGALKEHFSSYTVTAALQCAGNRRSEMAALAPIPGELPWDAGAAGNAAWTGVSLAEVVAAAGPHADALHVELTGLDAVQRQGKTFGFGGSIPLDKASCPEVLLAYAMNSQPLTPAHGYPLRAVVPGYFGARSVKWLAEIRLQREPSQNYFYAHAYQLFPPGARPETVDWSSGIKLGEMPVNTVICSPEAGARLSAGPVRVQGFALSSRPVARVEVSVNGGQTWVVAGLGQDSSPWAWRFWEVELTLQPGPVEIVCRAWDAAANTQPEHVAQVWNFKGYVNNAWHRVPVLVGR